MQALAGGWHVPQHATPTKDYGSRKRLTHAAEGSFDSAASRLPEQSEALRKERVAALDAEGRSAALVEHGHSTLRPLRETCRGQVDQEMLALCA